MMESIRFFTDGRLAAPAEKAVGFADLPLDLVRLVLLHAPVTALVAARRVCASWRRICDEPAPWAAQLWAALGATAAFAAVCDAAARKWEGDWTMLHPPAPGTAPVARTFTLRCHADAAALSGPRGRGVRTGRIGDNGHLLTLRRGDESLTGRMLEQGGARKNRRRVDFLGRDGSVAFTWHRVERDVCGRCRELRPHVRRDWHDSRILLCLDCWDERNAAPSA
jgi:hypothetical protein